MTVFFQQVIRNYAYRRNYADMIQPLENGTAQTKNGGQPLAIFLQGSLNPVHRLHVGTLVAAKEAIDATGTFEVVRGFLGTTPIEHLKSKGKPIIKWSLRSEMIARACDPHPWMFPDFDAQACTPGTAWNAVNELLPQWRAASGYADLVGALVLGDDAALKYPGETMQRPVVVLCCREGQDHHWNLLEEQHRAQDEEIRAKARNEGKGDIVPGPFFIVKTPDADVSSSRIRKAMEERDTALLTQDLGEENARLLLADPDPFEWRPPA